MPATKKENAQNPNNSSVVQILLDAISQGAPADLCKDLISYFDCHTDERIATDELFAKHQYPEDRLIWNKSYIDVKMKLANQLDPYDIAVLSVMEAAADKKNLIQVSMNDLKNILHIDKKTTIKAVSNLIDYGCIAIWKPSVSKYPAVYMVNPLICGKGKTKQHSLLDEFWRLTGTRTSERENGSGRKQLICSEPHQWWNLNIDTYDPKFKVGNKAIKDKESYAIIERYD